MTLPPEPAPTIIDHYEVWCVFSDDPRPSIHVLTYKPGETATWTATPDHVGGHYETYIYPKHEDDPNLHGSLAGVPQPTPQVGRVIHPPIVTDE